MITYETLRDLGKPIAYFPKLAKPLGGANAAILFGHLQYWQERTDNPLGVYKTQEQLEEDTGLTVREQKTACEKLEKLGILTKTHKRLQHRMYYKLNKEAFDALMVEFFEKNKCDSGSDKSVIPEPTNVPFPNRQKRDSGSDKSAIGRTDKNAIGIRNKDYQRIHTEITDKDVCAADADTSHAPMPADTGSQAEDTEAPKPAKPKKPKTEKASGKQKDLALLAEYGITGQLAEDYIAHRNVKKATVSVTVLEAVKDKAAQLNLSLAQAIQLQLEQGWTGFEVEWVLNRMGLGNNNRNTLPAKPSARDVPHHTQGGVLDLGRKCSESENVRCAAEVFPDMIDF